MQLQYIAILLAFVASSHCAQWTLAEIQQKLEEVIKQQVPIGFTYVQLPNEKSPKELWPKMTWMDISSTYAGVFFRVEGGDSGKFGAVQAENLPTKMIDEASSSSLVGEEAISLNPEISGWSEYIHTGTDTTGEPISIRFHRAVAEGEVRPRNMAIRVWKRSA